MREKQSKAGLLGGDVATDCSLGELRGQIASIDAEILEAFERRQALAEAIIRAKGRRAAAIYDAAQESRKLAGISGEAWSRGEEGSTSAADAERQARAHRALLRCLMRLSCEEQLAAIRGTGPELLVARHDERDAVSCGAGDVDPVRSLCVECPRGAADCYRFVAMLSDVEIELEGLQYEVSETGVPLLYVGFAETVPLERLREIELLFEKLR